jgi:hypothetical protein
VVAGNRVANGEEIWLHPDGSLHKYHWTATWETEEAGCSQRLYMVPASEVDISLEDLMEAIECNRELVPLALKTTYK